VTTNLNLGCGERFHPDWINIDIAPRHPAVRALDFTKGLPFPAESVDAVYHAAVLEHIRKREVNDFLREIHRVLTPGGIVRVGVPDLEKICRIYLEKLEAALAGDKQAVADYDWIMLELLDQTVREKSGGEMLGYLQCNPLLNEQFVYERIGEEGRRIMEEARHHHSKTRPSFLSRLGSTARRLRHQLLGLLAGRDGARALAIGRFRLSGEAHQWMYDRFSLARELVAAGFREPAIRSAGESAIPDWGRFHLDLQPDGTLNKPDLLFMEAIKPNG
jgi:predicted SAM-dependent methyltransferase